MKNKRNIYCDYQFWEGFFGIEEEVVRNRKKRILWDAFYDFLSNNNLFFNIPKQDVNDETRGGINLNEIRHKKGGAGIKFIPNEFPCIESLSDSEDDRLNSVFLTMLDRSDCERLSKSFGIIVFNLEMVFTGEHVFWGNDTTLQKSNGLNWSYLLEWRDKCPSISYCNSLVLVDRYLLSDKNQNVFDKNIKPIFEAFLPQSLENDIIFTICIVAENICASIDQKLRKLERLVKDLRPNLRFKINIFDSRFIHDRSVLTNNVMLTSGAGFDVIGNNDIPMKFTTTSLSFPFLQSHKDSNTYLDWISNVLKVERTRRSYQENYWGAEETRHHLLDYYYEEPAPLRATFSIGDANREALLRALARN